MEAQPGIAAVLARALAALDAPTEVLTAPSGEDALQIIDQG